MEQIARWDKDAFVFVNGLGIEQYDRFWVFVTQIENWIPLYIIFFILYYVTLSRKRTLITTLFTFAVMGFTLGLTSVVKNMVGRLRPSNNPDIAQLIRILQTPEDFSFWSGHAATSFAITVFVVLVLRAHYKAIWLLFLWPILFSLSRIFVGVHYPIDLLVGAFVGGSIGTAFYYIYTHYFLTTIKK